MAKQKQENRITLNSGVVLELRRVGYFIAQAATRRLKAPEVPEQDIGKGRPEPNPMHPAYIAALEEYQAQQVQLVFDAFLWFGTKVVSIPDSVPGPDSDWPADYAFLGIEVPEQKQERYVNWLKLVATLGDEAEITNLIRRIRGESVVTEEEVANAAEGFPGTA